MSRNHDFRLQSDRIEYLHLTNGRTSRIGQIAMVRIRGERTKASAIRRCITYRVHNFHVTNVVNVQALFQTNNQSRAVQLHAKYRIRVRVIAYLRPFLEVANLEKWLKACGLWSVDNEQVSNCSSVVLIAERICF